MGRNITTLVFKVTFNVFNVFFYRIGVVIKNMF